MQQNHQAFLTSVVPKYYPNYPSMLKFQINFNNNNFQIKEQIMNAFIHHTQK